MDIAIDLPRVALLLERIKRSDILDHLELDPIEVDGPFLNVVGLAKGLEPFRSRGIRPVAAVMNARTYSDIRRGGRDGHVMRITKGSEGSRLTWGLMATFDDTLLMITRDQPVDEVLVLGELVGDDGALRLSAQCIQVVRVRRQA